MNDHLQLHTIRTESEFDLCVNIVETAFSENGLLDISKYRSSKIAKLLRYEIENPFSCYDFKALKIDNQFVAYAELRDMMPIVTLNMIAVSKYHKGKGVGKFFLDSIIQDKKRLNYSFLILHVFGKNYHALKFYEKYPFLRTQTRVVCKLKEHQHNFDINFQIVNFHQFIADRVAYGFVYLRILYKEKIIDWACVENNLIVSNATNEFLKIACILKKSLKFNNIFFIKDADTKHNFPMEIIDEIYTLEMPL